MCAVPTALAPRGCSRHWMPRADRSSASYIDDIGPRSSARSLIIIDAAVPAELSVQLILDNYGPHKKPTIHRWVVRRSRSTFTLPPPAYPGSIQRSRVQAPSSPPFGICPSGEGPPITRSLEQFAERCLARRDELPRGDLEEKPTQINLCLRG